MLLGLDTVWLEAECSRYEFFGDVVGQTNPDVGFVALDSNPEKALELVASLAKTTPSCDILVTSSSADGNLILRTMRAGAKEFLTHPVKTEDMAAALQRVAKQRGGSAGGGARACEIIAVTGATGGVGSMAVAMLAGLGFTVAASTGKVEAAPFLRGLGASEIIDREELTDVGKPLQSVRWSGAVDAVGGPTLAHVLATLAPGGAVAASGNVGGADLPTTVLPFILRGVTLFGIDSAGTPIDRRREVWARIASDLKPAVLDAMAQEVDLAHLEGALDEIGRGGVTGRYLVQLGS